MDTTKEKQYFRSHEELFESGFKLPEPEFSSTPQEEVETDEGRRDFIKLMGASIAMFGATACTRRPVEKIVPYVKQPEGITPGVSNWYASSCGECETGCGVLVKTRDGRPIKLEGNPAHPISQGGLCSIGQASVLNLYDPDRLRSPANSARKANGSEMDWKSLDDKTLSAIKDAKAKGTKVVLLTGAITSPSTNKMIAEFARAANAQHISYEILNYEELALANQASYGSRAIPRYRFDQADMIVSFGADFLETWGSGVENSKAFSRRRKLGKTLGSNVKANRLVSFETMLTLTGSNADERFRVRSGSELKVALALAYELIVAQSRSKYAGDSQVTSLLQKYAPAKISSELGIKSEVFKKVAAELWESRGKSIVIGGGFSTKGDHGVALETVVNLLNSALENEGATIDGTSLVTNEDSSFDTFKKLISDMSTGRVGALLIYKTNPAYFLPKVIGFDNAMAKVPFVLNFNTHMDETAALSDVVAAANHSLESWGDVNPQAGVYSILQPTISPMYSTRGFEECLMNWTKALGASVSATNWHEYVKGNWKDIQRTAGNSSPFMTFWENTLHEGVFDYSKDRKTDRVRERSFNKSALNLVDRSSGEANGMMLTLYPKVSQLDGRFANNSWLQELPDPVSKVTWDNYASVSVGYAKQNNLKTGDVVRIKAGDISVDAPIMIQPGNHDTTVALAIGYGRTGAGEVGNGVGVNAFPLAMHGKQALQMSAIPVSVEKTGKKYDLATTQKHHSMESRPIVKETTFSAFQKDPHSGNAAHEEDISLWPKHPYPGYRWGMSIDLNSCTGCGSCVIGCQSENNIPVVGKKNVLASREMHWLRIDRYYSGRVDQPDDIETVHQPMMCQHCENAPCETVCPVLATLHDHEGLNQQVYNRCVGTRYCANNCPYKVRRFNWFTFTDVAKPQQLAYNPDVTVRTRGIMEKCTFCVQRIREVKDTAKDQSRAVRDGEVKTACQQSCPTDAIYFGNVNDKNSQVAQLNHSARAYTLLPDLNVKSSISYLTKIRNKEEA